MPDLNISLHAHKIMNDTIRENIINSVKVTAFAGNTNCTALLMSTNNDYRIAITNYIYHLRIDIYTVVPISEYGFHTRVVKVRKLMITIH
jgi:hypothetical protein